jgi:hypothetical protein
MTSVHRLLDEAFAGAPLSPEVADLKEEIRSGLLDRATELEAEGLTPDDAAHRAFAELGDVGALIAEVTDTDPGRPTSSTVTGPARTFPHQPDAARLAQVNRVRVRPGFVLGVVGAALVAALCLAFAGLGAGDVVDLPAAAVAALLVTAASAVGFIVGSSLAQETTTNHPMPAGRAGGYYAATSLTTLGLLLALFTLLGTFPVWTYVFAGIVALAGAGLFVWLGVTQTNRKKAWAREVARAELAHDRFNNDPAAAARFGIYTGVIWVGAFVITAALGVAGYWRWSWLALVVGWAVMMILLARMQFGRRDNHRENTHQD